MGGLLVANRGEIAIRVIRAAAELGLRTVAVHAADDADCLHTRRADEARGLRGTGAAAYLDGAQLIAIARETGCDSIHPGYGFLSESGGFARACADNGLVFVGPRVELLELFGDKSRARAFASGCGVSVLGGTAGPTTAEEAATFLGSLQGHAMVIKAIAGGGGRGMRVVRHPHEVHEAHTRCGSEALQAFGNGDVYVERFVPRARHVEVQIIGDSAGVVNHLGERDCTLQRRFQKLVEVAPSPWLSAHRRAELIDAALTMARAARYDSLGTFEFLIAADGDGPPAFIEANPRLQVEHTVTEEVTGVDLVRAQLELARGRTLEDLALSGEGRPPRGFAIQVRVNAETMSPDGTSRPSSGTLTAFEPPAGPGIRVDTAGYVGYRTNPRYDSLLAKVIARASNYAEATARVYRALCEFRIDGVATNLEFLQAVLRHPDVEAGAVHTRFLEERAGELTAPGHHPRLFFEADVTDATGSKAMARRAGAKIDTTDPLAVLHHGKLPVTVVPAAGSVRDRAGESEPSGIGEGPQGRAPVNAPMQGTIVTVDVAEGQLVHAGQALLVMEAMKMQHVVVAERGGLVRAVVVQIGDTVVEGEPLVFIDEADVVDTPDASTDDVDLDRVRPDLAEVLDRHALGLDEARPDAVARRRATAQRTARENVEDLCDDGTFVEYGPLVIAAQRRRRPVQELIERTPADGLVAGIGHVNGHLVGPDRSQCIVMSYDYTVLAGTQGQQNHRKKDRMFELAEQARLPIVFLTEGGGGRPGDTDGVGVAGLDCMAFAMFAGLSGLVPLVGITSGRCFAGNAALLGCCDVVIATRDSNIGMGGPAMVEGGGLGIYRPEEIGPTDVQVENGVIDLLVDDEAEAVAVAKRYLSYFQGSLAEWTCADQRLLRGAIPANRLRVYDVRRVIDTLADDGSVLELRTRFGLGMVTALARIEGRPIGIIANNPTHLAGAIDANGADKAARFMQLCDAFDLPLLFLCDTPGIMVGPEVEKTALVRHCSRMFVTGASLTVPFFTIVLRKGYGLGAQAMAGGSFKAPFFTVAWPTGEFGGMGLEGAVKLGYRNELASLQEPEARRALFDEMVAKMYAHGKAVNTASLFEIDDVIDPATSRNWIVNALHAAPRRERAAGRRRPCIDTW